MFGRISCILFVAASAIVHVMPTVVMLVLLTCCLLAVISITILFVLTQRKTNIKTGVRIVWLLPVAAALLGITTTYYRIEVRLADHLATSNINKVSRVHAQVISLPKHDAGGLYFDADIIAAVPNGVPKRIRITWPQPSWRGPYAQPSESILPSVKPGEVWRMALTIRPVHGLQNPGGFDYEAYAFATGIRAMGTVRGNPWLVEDRPYTSLSILSQRARYYVREKLAQYTQGQRYGAVIVALALGDQAGVNASDWQVFNRTGITHLVSISGTHVTIISGLFGFIVFFIWRRLPYKGHMLAEKLPAQIVAASFALITAWLYCLLAGWGVPAQRTFYMLAAIVFTYVIKLRLSSSQILCLVAVVVVVLDPWAVFSTGFWLSFGAVAVLILVAQASVLKVYRPSAPIWRTTVNSVVYSTKLQLAITAALFPLLALLFHEISIVSPLVNAYAIPLVSFLITPLALFSALLACIPNAEIYTVWVTNATHALINAMMVPTVFMADNKLASFSVAHAPLWATVMAIAGLLMALLPRGLPGRSLAWLLILPAILWVPASPKQGYWDAYVLDVGQASAIVLQTANHTFLFDTGLRNSLNSDSATRVIIPFFKYLGIDKLDVLFVSHADIDHAGGLHTLLNNIGVEQSYASFHLGAWIQRESKLLGEHKPSYVLPNVMSLCSYGTNWDIDGVSFQVLWPLAGQFSGVQAQSKERNNNSCVLSVRGKNHSILFTGDINALQERNVVQMGLLPHDVAIVAHHGSKTSSDANFVATVKANHAIIQAGAFNRYGHPDTVVIQRWEKSGAQLWRTDTQGAITIKSGIKKLNIYDQKSTKYKYWHG